VRIAVHVPPPHVPDDGDPGGDPSKDACAATSHAPPGSDSTTDARGSGAVSHAPGDLDAYLTTRWYGWRWDAAARRARASGAATAELAAHLRSAQLLAAAEALRPAVARTALARVFDPDITSPLAHPAAEAEA
jgi:hypothetical protein